MNAFSKFNNTFYKQLLILCFGLFCFFLLCLHSSLGLLVTIFENCLLFVSIAFYIESIDDVTHVIFTKAKSKLDKQKSNFE